MELAEVYRFVYVEGPDDMLRGTIVCKDEENGHQDLLNDKGLGDDTTFEERDYNSTFGGHRDDNSTFEGYKDDDNNQLNLRSKPLVRSLDHIIPNGPTKASICAKNGFSISFDLFEVISEELTIEYPRSDMLSSPLVADFLSKDGTRYLTVLYAIFKNAVEAHVNVTLTNNSDPFYLYGVIAARTSAIDERAYSSLIFLKGHDEKIKVGNGKDIVIPFSRRIVAVPLRSQLILEFSLNVPDNDKTVEDGNDKIVEEIVTFKAKRGRSSKATINCSKGKVEVVVKWTSVKAQKT